jgi:hypothetical protein
VSSSLWLSSTEPLVPLAASIVGMIVFLGLWIEKEAEEEEEKKHAGILKRGARATRVKSEVGWWILMVGIFVEIIVGGWFAASDAWAIAKMNPKNQNIFDMSAIAWIRTSGDRQDMVPWNTQRAASLLLCENNNFNISTFPALNADSFDRSPGFGLEGVWSVYTCRFQSDGTESFAEGMGLNRPVKDFEKVKTLRLDLKFLPKGTQILDGSVIVVANDNIRKIFKILPQIDSNPVDGTPNSPYVVIATNSVPDIGTNNILVVTVMTNMTLEQIKHLSPDQLIKTAPKLPQ